MSRTFRSLALASVFTVAVSTLPPRSQPVPVSGLGPTRLVAETFAAIDAGDTVALRFAGRLPNQSSDPTHLVFTGEVRSMSTGEVVGTMTHDVTCLSSTPPPCAVLDAVNTFRLAEGALVNHALESVAPDPQHADFVLIGNHPPGESIVSGTGAYEGRTGRAHMSARHEISELPGFATFDDFWLIELDPR